MKKPFLFPQFVVCCALLFLMLAKGLHAQNNLEGLGIEANFIKGKIIKHTPNFRGPIPANSPAVDINFVWKTRGNKEWQQRRSYPTLGLGITYTQYDKEAYGYGIGVYPNLELPFIRKQKWEWTLRLGMSFGYIQKRYAAYPPYWDTLNNSLGSHLNNFTLFSNDIRYHINSHWDLQAGFTFTHMSFAKYRRPNLGINLFGAHLGVRYFPTTSQPSKIVSNLKPLSNRFLLQVRQGISMSTGESPGSAATPVYLSSLFLSKRYWSKNKVFVGVDYSYHRSFYDFQRLQGIAVGNENKDATRVAIFAGHEFLYGAVGVHLQMGYYIHSSAATTNKLYEKLGINWYLLQKEKGFFKEIYLSTLLKTHLQGAELAELGLGFSF